MDEAPSKQKPDGGEGRGDTDAEQDEAEGPTKDAGAARRDTAANPSGSLRDAEVARDAMPGKDAVSDGKSDASAPASPRDAASPQTDAAAAGCGSGDPKALLQGSKPTDEDLAKDFDSYLADLAQVTCATQGTGGRRTLSQTIIVPPGAVYDGRGETITADVAALECDTSEGEQGESQMPLFVLAEGASLRNVTITFPGCEGVHMMGDNEIDNVIWEDVGEDAASVRSYFPGGRIVIKNSKAHKASDKTFQFNASCDVRIENFTGSEMGKLVRQNGGETFELKIDLNNVMVTGVVSAVVQSDSPACFVRHHELSYQFAGSGDKADRVFRDIPPANVTEY